MLETSGPFGQSQGSPRCQEKKKKKHFLVSAGETPDFVAENVQRRVCGPLVEHQLLLTGDVRHVVGGASVRLIFK